MRKVPHLLDPAEDPLKKNKGRNGWISIRKIDEYLRFVLFLALVAIIYIWNAHHADNKIRERDKLKAEVKTLKAEYYMRKADLSANTRYTNMIANLDSMGLYRPQKAPFKLLKNPEKR